MALARTAHAVFVAEHVVDREEECRLFDSLLDRAADPRLLAIQVGNGCGKTQLLRKLRHRGRLVRKPPVPVSLLALDELEEEHLGDRFELVRRMVEQLTKHGVCFSTFEKLNRARVQRNVAALRGETGRVSGEARADHVEAGAQVAGVILNNSVVFNASDWNDELNELVKADCVEAFQHELRAAAAKGPVVLLFDAYECASDGFHDWLLGLVSGHLCDADRPTGLAVVIAGEELRMQDFEAALECGSARLIERLERLSDLERRHVELFMRYRGLRECAPKDVTYLYESLLSGWTLAKADSFIRSFLLEQAVRGGG